MARIRSLHPGFFTDEDLVETTMEARMLYLGLGVEADDKGIFEWKPLTLKMRLFPADNLDVVDLLTELERANMIASYEMDGKKYGAIRNFKKYQKPKTPNDVHPMPDHFRKFIGLKDAISESESHNPESLPQKGEIDLDKEGPFPLNGEKSFQMEGRREEIKVKGEINSIILHENDDEEKSDFERLGDKLIETLGEENVQSYLFKAYGEIFELVLAGIDIETDILPTMRAVMAKRKDKTPVRAWSYFVDAIKADYEKRIAAGKGITAPKPFNDSDKQWAKRLRFGRKDSVWDRQKWGPAPGEAGCKVPASLLQNGDGVGWKEYGNAA